MATIQPEEKETGGEEEEKKGELEPYDMDRINAKLEPK